MFFSACAFRYITTYSSSFASGIHNQGALHHERTQQEKRTAPSPRPQGKGQFAAQALCYGNLGIGSQPHFGKAEKGRPNHRRRPVHQDRRRRQSLVNFSSPLRHRDHLRNRGSPRLQPREYCRFHFRALAPVGTWAGGPQFLCSTQYPTNETGCPTLCGLRKGWVMRPQSSIPSTPITLNVLLPAACRAGSRSRWPETSR